MTSSYIRALYICYFGLREPLVQTQVLPYLKELHKDGIEISLLTFEPDFRTGWTQETILDWKRRLAADGIHWHSLPYHKRPTLPATLFDILCGILMVFRLSRQSRIDVLHGRSHVGAAIGAFAKKLTGAKLIFDIRGFMPEEYVDAERWPKDGLLYRWTKSAERRLMDASDGFIVLTERAREILFPGCSDTDSKGRPFEVIPCCVNLERFRAVDGASRQEMRSKLGLEGRRVFIYVGALGGWYMVDEMAGLMVAAKSQDPSSFFLVLTQSDPELILGPLRRAGLSADDILVRKVLPAEVADYLRAADIALSLIKPCFSKISSSPTKIAEYLASGLPVLSTSGIGDIDACLSENNVGILIPDLNREGYIQALHTLEVLREDPGLSRRCQQVAIELFDIEVVGGPRYRPAVFTSSARQSNVPGKLELRPTGLLERQADID